MKTVCLTGEFPEGRGSFLARLRDKGFEITGHVSINLGLLVVGVGANSVKLQKAHDLGLTPVSYPRMCEIAGITPCIHVAPNPEYSKLCIELDADTYSVKQKAPEPERVGTGWYDYGTLLPVNLPPLNIVVLYESKESNQWYQGVIINHYSGDVVVIDKQNGNAVRCDLLDIKPLDWDKKTRIPVDLSWLVDTGIDCVFSNGNRDIDKLSVLTAYGDAYRDVNNIVWPTCKPRLNRWMITDGQTLHSIPSGFDVVHLGKVASSHEDETMYAFMIKGLKDGYCWPWEV